MNFGMDHKLTNQLVILWHDISCWNFSQDRLVLGSYMLSISLKDYYNLSYVLNENEAYFY